MKTMILASFKDNVRAHMMQDILKNEGIESMIQSELTSQVFSYLRGIEIQLLVFEKDYDRARELLKESFPEEA